MRPARSRVVDPESLDLTIDTIGDGGDGIAEPTGRRIFVPWTLPGERVRARRTGPHHAVPVEWLVRAGARAEASCPHFATCGGCALQHLQPDSYAAWKRARAQAAAIGAGFPEAVVAPLVSSPPASRRRATLAALRSRAGVTLGFHAPASTDIVDITTCPVLVPEIATRLDELRAALVAVLTLTQRCDVAITSTQTGLDVLIIGAVARDRLNGLAARLDLARLSLARDAAASAELIALNRAPLVRFGTVGVEPPPHAFLQATREGEHAITSAVLAGLGNARRVLDLHAGCGTLALPIAQQAHVLAVDVAADSLAALDAAARRSGLGAQVKILARDLVRRPLLGSELDGWDAAVFDPPREGARAQATALAASSVQRVIAVSCNPASFTADAIVLRNGGYLLEHLTPIDQFLWSPHVELVGVFSRPPVPRKRR